MCMSRGSHIHKMVSVFGKQFIWDLHNILNFPKYILLDPYKRNLNKVQQYEIKFVATVIKYLLPLIYTYKMPHNELVYPRNVLRSSSYAPYRPVPQHEDSILTLCTSFIIGKNQKFVVLGVGFF